jgi:hypothetical protein
MAAGHRPCSLSLDAAVACGCSGSGQVSVARVAMSALAAQGSSGVHADARSVLHESLLAELRSAGVLDLRTRSWTLRTYVR